MTTIKKKKKSIQRKEQQDQLGECQSDIDVAWLAFILTKWHGQINTSIN